MLPYGEPHDGFFPDTLLAQLAADARALGHRAELVRVYYDGADPARDREITRRLEAWLAERAVDLVVTERVVDPMALERHRKAAPGRLGVLVWRGDSFDPVPGVDLVVGADPGTARGTRRTPTEPELALAFRRLVTAVARGDDPAAVPGVGRVVDDQVETAAPLDRPLVRRPYRAVVEQDVIAPGGPPRAVRKTLVGNMGCPFAADPMENPHYAGVSVPAGQGLARLGCAFCHMGGDYEKRPDGEVVDSLVEQAAFWSERAPWVEEFVLSDQHPQRYLAALVRAAAAAGVRPVRWLFAARADAFVRERVRIEAAIAAAEDTGHVLEAYLSGFEAFSDRELARYNKGTTVADLLAAVEAMRSLAAAHPRAFAYDRARGHSLILWNPWTTPEDLRDGVRVMRTHGLAGLFHEMGRNRLRLYRDLPIYHAAARDHALADAWEDGDEGAARRKGYSTEHPWRFLDPRTRVAHGIAQGLRARLGQATEPAQLAAAADHAVALDPAVVDPPAVVRAALAGTAALEAALAAVGARSDRAAVMRFTGACNNRCGACANQDAWADDAADAVLARVDAARAEGGAVVLAGREPTLHPAFLQAVARARGADRRTVTVVTNGRRFAYPTFAQAAARAGLRAAGVKLFAADADTADRITAAPGAHDQALAGLGNLRAAGVALEVRAPLHRANLDRFADYAPLARAAGATLRVEAALDAVGLDRLADAAAAVARLAARCAAEGVALTAAPLRAGPRG